MKWNRVFQTAAVVGMCATAPAWAVDVYRGFDLGPTGGAWLKGNPKPNADAAQAAFAAAATSINDATGGLHVVDFEAPAFTAGALLDTTTHFAPGSSVQIAPGVTMNVVSANARTFISDVASSGFGSPTSGDQRLWLDSSNSQGPVELELVFDDPIIAFGAYFAGMNERQDVLGAAVDPGSPRVERVEIIPNGPNKSEVFSITEAVTPGVEFFGFVGGTTNSVNIRLELGPLAQFQSLREILAIDDIQWVNRSVPEPFTATLAGLGMGALALQTMRRRRA